MADEGYDRDFPGNPNPSPKAPASRPTPAAPVAESTGGGGQAAAPAAPAPAARPKARYQVVDAPTGYEIYADMAEESSEHIGTAKIPEAAEVLKASGAYYNETAKLWEDVPEDVVRSLQSGKMGLPEYVFARYKQGEVGALRSALGAKIVNGEMSVEEAMARGNEALLKAQVSSEPELAFNGGFKKFAIEAMQSPRKLVRYALGAVAENLPNVRDAILADLKGQVKGAAAGAGAAVAGLATGPVAPATASAALAGGALIGGEWQSWKFFVDTNMGETAIGMAEKGFDAKTIQKWAPLAGVIKGTMDKASFGLLTAPAKQTFVAKVLNLPVVKRAIASAYVQYAASIGAEATTEAAQTYVDQVVNNMAATAINRPDLFADPEKSKDELLDSAFQALFSAAAVGGAASVAGKAMASAASAGERKTQAKTAAKLEEYRKAAPVAESPASKAEAPVPVSAPAAEAAATPGVTPAAQALDTAEAQPESPEAAKAAVDAVSQEAEKAPAKSDVPLAQRVRDIERKSEITRIQAELKDVDAQIAELSVDRDARIANKQTTAHLDSQVDALVKQGENLRAQLAYQEQGLAGMPGAEEAVDRRADVTLSAATLEDIVEAGFKEGSKESKTRARKLLAIAQEQGLNRADVNKILKNKVLGTMGAREFETYTEDFQARAEQAAVRKGKEKELRDTIKERRIKKADYIRKFLELPKVSEMTDEQVQQYIDAVKGYDEGSTVLSDKRAKVHATTEGPMKGVKTVEDVVKRAAEILGKPAETVLTPEALKVGELDVFKGDEVLKDRGPVIGLLVRIMKGGQEQAAAWYQAIHEQEVSLFAKALSSRRKLMGAGERVADWFAPQQKALMAYMEEQNPEKRAALREDLTREEAAYADFLADFFQQAEDYLIKVQGLKSRYSGSYVPHFRRSLAEMVRDLPDTGVKKFFKELAQRYSVVTDNIIPETRKDQALGLLKSFKNALQRTGDLEPSKNVHRAFDKYAQMFYTKVALDSTVSTADTVILAVRTADKTEEHAATKAIAAFAKEYLNAKKGNAAWAIKQGGIIEAFFRASQSLAALWYIAGHVNLQIASQAGELATGYLAVGARKLALAKARRLTAHGRDILKKYAGFVGEGPVTQFLEPGKPLLDRLDVLLYGSFVYGRARTMGDILLGNMTEEEYKSGEISQQRLAEIKLAAARWVDIRGMKGVRGSSVLGATVTQFKGWAIPPAITIGKDLKAWAGRVFHPGNPEYKLTLEQWQDFYRLATLSIIAGYLAARDSDDDDDDSMRAQLKRRTLRELATPWQAVQTIATMGTAATLGVGPALVGKLATDLIVLGKILADEEKDSEDVKRQLVRMSPSAIKQFIPKEER